MRKTAAAVLVSVLLAVLTACGSADRADSAAVSAFAATTIRLEGPWYSFDLPQVEGGTEDARTDFNDGMRAELDPFLRAAAQDRAVKGFNSEVAHIGRHVLSGVLGIEVEVDGGKLHPTTFKRTHVTDIDTGKALTLPDLFSDLPKALDRLSAQAEVQIRKTRVGTNPYDKQRIAPAVENFKDWLAMPDGLRVYLGEIASHALGYIDITIPWSELDAVLKPGLRAVVSS
ncbi:RsiV family protein [Nocardia vinacea]|uniref:RsiV family protein n=1 Tax=Nocardia vinacea TaxID=96468 RepID=UPI000314A55D|nr:RsiV family protein [Nocardia vinacea]